MGSLNFQDEPNPKPPQRQPDPTPRKNLEDSRVDDIFVDGPGTGSKLLLIAAIVVVLAGIGGGLYYLNQRGYLKFGHKPTPTVTQRPVVTPPVAQPTPTPTTPAPAAANVPAKQPGKFALQVSAFRTQAQADRYVRNLKTKGLDAYVFAGDVPNAGKWFKVCVGSYDTKLQALAETEKMKEKVGTDVWVVPAQ